MNARFFTVGFAVGIVVLFMLNRDRKARTSWALWIPVVWLLVAGSRNVGEWLQQGSTDAGDRYLEGNPVDRDTLTVLLTLGAIVLAGRARRVWAILRANTPVLLFLFYCCASSLWSDYPQVAFKRWIRALGDIVMVLVVLTDANGLAAIKRLFTRVGFLLLPLSVLLIRYYPDWGRAYGKDGSLYWTGVTGGKNGLGMICLIFGLASVWGFLAAFRERESTHRTRQLLVHSAVVAVALWLLWHADSKTSLFSFLLASSLIAVTSFSTLARKPAALHLLVAAIVAASCSVLFLGIGGDVLKTMGRDATLTGRTEVWNLVLTFAESPWFGAGYESFWLGRRLEEITRINGGMNQAHNGYIEIYLNLGWIGLTLLAAIIVMGYRRIVAGFRWDPELCTVRIAYFVIAVVYNFTEGAFKMMCPVWIAFLLATMAIPQPRASKARTVAPKVSRNRFYTDLPVARVHS